MADEPSTYSRRAVLAAVVCSVAAASGCTVLDSDSPMVDLVFFNNTDSRFVITVHLRASRDDQPTGETTSRSETIDIPPQETVRRADVAKRRQYLIEYDVDKIVDGDPLQTDHGHAHFYPTADSDSPSVAFDIVDAGTLHKRVA